MGAKNVEDVYPLSPMQEGLLFHSLYAQDHAVYVTHITCTLEQLDVDAFARAWQRVVDRHPALRTAFVWQKLEKPLQVVTKRVSIKLNVEDWRGLSKAEQDARLDAFLKSEQNHDFRLSKAPLVRLTLFRVGAETFRFVYSHHHLLLDGWSDYLLLQEVFTFYEAYHAGRELQLELPRPYRDYIAWLGQQDLAQAERFWRELLQGFDSPTVLSVDQAPGGLPSQDETTIYFRLPAEITDALRAQARRQGLTLNTLTQGVWALLLSRYSGQQDVVFGATVSGRPVEMKGVDRMLGVFINTLPVRARVAPAMPVFDWFHELQKAQLTMRQFEHSPLVQVQGWSDVPRGLPLFDTILDFENHTAGTSLEELGQTLRVREVKTDIKMEYPLFVKATPGRELLFTISYDRQRFDDATITRLTGHLETLLSEVATADETKRVCELEWLTENERTQILCNWNDTELHVDRDLSIADEIAARAAEMGDAVALVCGAEELTYAELNARASQLGHYLQRLGVGPESVVGVRLERSIDLVVALFGVLKSGGAYLPLDPSYPEERLSWMLADSGARVVLSDLQPSASESREDLRADVTNENLAYVIYTSGSTGRPKGVMVQQGNVKNFFRGMDQSLSNGSADGKQETWLAVTSVSFDISVLELLWSLRRGSRVVLQSETGLGWDVEITHLQCTPTLAGALLQDAEAHEGLKRLEQLLVGGEALPGSLAGALRETVKGSVHNMYGPTETTIWSTTHVVEVTDAETPIVSIGRPIANTHIYLLDDQLQPVPVGVRGEVYIGGEGVARGYWNRGELTAERFVPDPFSRRGGQRLYRTGDEARYLANGEIEYLGRSDQQVKLRGYRIELGEIEAALREYEGVTNAAVAVRGERLVAYVVGETIDANALRQHLQERLPEYMVPSFYVNLAALPQTPNGKLDRKALPEPEAGAVAEYEAPRTPVEEVLAAIIAEVLSVVRVGRHDNFFALGGHSLLAMQVISRIREAFQVELPVRVLFESPTLAGIGRHLEQGAVRVDAPPLRRVDRNQPLPLSFAQQRLWFLDRFEADRHIFNMAVRVELRGRVDQERLEESLNRLLMRHEVLRTSFREVGGQPVQEISESVAIELAADLQDEERIAAEEVCTPFELERAPLLRARLVRRDESNHLLLLTLHHAICDGWSLGLLLKELAAFYAGDELPELPVQYADYAVWQREWLQGAVLDGQLSYWRERLQGASAALELPTDYPRPALHRYRAATLRYEFGAELSKEMQALSRREGVTLLMLLLASLQVLLSRYTNSQDISVGVPIAGRNRVECEGLVGLFLNTLVLRTEWSGDPTFRELLAKVREVALGAYAHQELPFEKLVEELQPERDLSRTPLFQVMLVLQNIPLQPPSLKDLEVGSFAVATRSTNYDLTFSINETDAGLEILLDYNAFLFKEERMQRLLRHWERLLQSVVATPNSKLPDLQWLTDDERKQLVYGWNQTHQPYDTTTTVVDLIAQQAAQHPDAIAIISGQEQLTYAELNERANQLAQHLREQGVGPETIVGVCMERTVALPVALLGVLKSGGAYLPLDPSYPRERVAWILADAGVEILLTEAGETRIKSDLENRIWGGQLAYLIYTSGSTGRPKGVQVTHANLVNFLLSMQAQPGLTAEDTLLAVTTLAFDIAGLEIYLPLITGGRLVLASRAAATDGRELLKLLRESGATVMQATPATWRLLLDALVDANERLQLKVLCGGEALPGSLVAALQERIDGPIYNLYGPTETTIWSALHTVEAGDAETPIVSLGRPIANTQLYLLDEAMQPVPVGVRGELYIGGEGVARGYWRRGELTAARFVPDPFSHRGGQRLYRTGDEARYLENGEIEYLGRSDQQVKLRGYRIELGEIEAALREHESVSNAAVAVKGERLVAYVVGESIDSDALRQHLQQRLPDYMVPSTYVPLAALPQTPNGKLDRKALPEPEAASVSEYEAPRTPIEEVLAAIVADVLKVPRVSRQDNFFSLGGHSLLAMQVVSRIREAFHVELPVRTLFETPTLAGLAHHLERNHLKTPDAPPLQPIPRTSALPLSFAQQRLWFLDQLEPGTPLYNIPAAVRLTGELDLTALERAFDALLRRHESLRTHFETVNGRAVQVIEPELKLHLAIEDLQHLAPDAQDSTVLTRTRDEAQKPFNLSQSPLLRVTLLRLADDEHIMLVTIHHIIGDEWSMGVLVRELATLYSQTPLLHDLHVQYADYAAWQREWLQDEFLSGEIDYWRRQLDRLPVLDLPTDRPRPAVQTYHGARYSLDLAPNLSTAIDTLAQQQRTTRFMTLLAAFQTLLHRYTTQDDIVVGTPIAGRSRLETESVIGLFVNTVVLRVDLSGDPDFNELLRRVRHTAFAAYAHQDVPFEKLVEQLQPDRDLSRTPLFQVGFVLHNDPLQTVEVPGLKLEPIAVDTRTAKFDLLLAMVEEADGLRGWVEYNTDLFDEETVARMAGHFQNLLVSIVEEPGKRLSQLEMLTDEERKEFHAKAQKSTQRRKEESLSRLFEAQVRKTPEAVALTFEDESMTYRELNARANRLARHLRDEGVGPETIVGICLERSMSLPVALLAVLKAGGAYLPIDPSYPRERVSWILEDAGARIVITEEYLERNETQIDTDLENTISSENLAYVIYTSGSTGRPKGVQVTHGNVLRLFAVTEDEFQFDQKDVWTLFHSFAFDFSVWEIWGALLYGGRLVIVPYLVSRTPKDFYQLLRTERVTILNQTPSSFVQLIKHERDAGPADDLRLRLVIFGGEALDLPSLRPWIANHGDHRPVLVNMYGITETTVHVTCRPLRAADIEQERGSLIGDAIDDLQLYILDQHQQPVPFRVPGELCVGGAGVARGYLNRPELTAQKFIPDPYSAIPGSRLYRSGDSARRLPDGEIEYLGRLDQQVKIRGFRIELGEIEATLVQHPAVRQCVVIARTDAPGEKHLTAYIVAQPGASPNVSDLRGSLKQRLPEYMIPASFVLLDKFPLTVNGKLDRRALPAPDNVRPELAGAYVAPETDVEKQLAHIWSEVLRLDRVGVNDSFFALGGDSIRSIEVRARAEQLGINFSLQQLFQFQTISELSQQLNGSGIKSSVESVNLLTDDDHERLPDGIEDAYPLAMLQAGMLFHSEYDADAATYHDVFSYRLRAPFAEAALRAAIKHLISRHAVLRTSFDVSSFSEPLQLVHHDVPVPFAVDDISPLAPTDQENVIAAWLSAEQKTRFDWTHPPLFRIQVHRRSEQEFQFSLSFHHAILDGWSVASLLTELFQTYLANLGQGHEKAQKEESLPETMYRDFIALERQALHSEEAKQFWQQKLDGASSNRLRRWTPRNDRPDESRVLTTPVFPEVFDGLKRLAHDVSAPLKSVLLAAHVRVLSLLSGQPEVTTGLVSNGRPEQAGAERTLGLFLNTLPVRADLRGGTWEDLVRETLVAERELLPFRWYPLASMQQQRGGEPLFETGFSFNHFHVYERLRDLEGIEVLDEHVFEQTNFTLGTIFNLDSTSSQLQLQLNYNAAELATEQVNSIAAYYLETLRRMAAEPTTRYEAVCLLPQSEQHRLLAEWNETKAEFPADRCVHEWFEAQVQRTPDAIALLCEDEQMTYRELNGHANRLARHLRNQGVGPETIVGVCLDRSLSLPVALLAVLKAGGAYLPLDPSYPRERLSWMLADAGAQIVIDEEYLERNTHDAQIDTDLESTIDSENLAYVIYTSGSTGRPKGVMISHQSVCNTLRWRQVAFSLSETDRILQTISIAFDPSVWQIFGSLVTGSCLVLAKPGGDKDVRYLLNVFREQEITIADFVPSMLQAFLEQQPQDACQHLRHVFCGGEVLPAELLDQYLRTMPGRIHNMYGPTEGTIDAACWHCKPLRAGESVSIGRPVANKQVYLLDRHLQPVPAGVPGHLHIGGAGLTRGYLDQPSLSAEKLIPDPFSTVRGARLYRTGDLARYLPDGRLEFLGRMDQQVKVRGFRIELEEIEATLAAHETVQAAVVVARERTKGVKDLVAYVVGDGGMQPSELRAYLRARLPEYMVPAYFVELEHLPLTPNGKLDRLALPAPAELRPQTETVYLAPRNEAEKIVAQIWQETLQLEQVGVHDNFFDLGGHSLLMLRVQGKVRTIFNRDLSIVEMFRYPTISSLAELLGAEPQKQTTLESNHERAAVARAATRRRRELRKGQPVA